MQRMQSDVSSAYLQVDVQASRDDGTEFDSSEGDSESEDTRSTTADGSEFSTASSESFALSPGPCAEC